MMSRFRRGFDVGIGNGKHEAISGHQPRYFRITSGPEARPRFPFVEQRRRRRLRVPEDAKGCRLHLALLCEGEHAKVGRVGF